MSKLHSSRKDSNLTKRIPTNYLVEGLAKNQSDWTNFINSYVEHAIFGLGKIKAIQLRPECVSDGPLITVVFDGHGEKLFNQRSFLSENFTFIECKSVHISLLKSNIEHNIQVELADAQRTTMIENRYLERQAKTTHQRELTNLNSRNKWIKYNNSASTGIEQEHYNYDRLAKSHEHENAKQFFESSSFSSSDNQGYINSKENSTILELHDEYSSYAAEVYSHDDFIFFSSKKNNNILEMHDEYSNYAINHDVPHFTSNYGKKDNSSREKIRASVKTYEISNVIHFTRIENLESILEYGLLSRSILNKSKLIYEYQDEYRLDGRIDAICLSISFPNWQLLYKAIKRSGHEDSWVVLELNPEILSSHDVAFTQKNAATSNQDTGLKRHSDFSVLFEEVPNKPSREQMGLPKNYPTNPQSEVLCFDSIKPLYIKGVHFPTNLVAEKYKYHELSERFKHVKFKINDYYFRPRSDSEYWKQSPKDIEVF